MIYYHNWANSDERTRGIEEFFGSDGYGFPRVDEPWVGDRAAEDGATIFVHSEPGPRIAFWLPLAEKNLRTNYVFMSTEPGTLANIETVERSNVHVCEFPAHQLAKCPQIREFIEELECGKANWELLRRKRAPQYLVAAYVLLLAKERGVIQGADDLGALFDRSDIWDGALIESDGAIDLLPKNSRSFLEMSRDDVQNVLIKIKSCLNETAYSR